MTAHNALTSYKGLSNGRASRSIGNFVGAKRIHWYSGLDEEVARDEFSLTRELNIEGWGGLYAQVALEEDVETILIIGDDFESFGGAEVEVILSPEGFAALNDYLGY